MSRKPDRWMKPQERVVVAPVQVHTLVLHRNPDFEVLFMAWLIVTHPRLRSFFNLVAVTKLKFKFIASGPLKAEDWPDETELSAPSLEKQGYLFLDCGGGGAMLDQHGAAPNKGRKFDVVASVNMLAGKTDLFDTDPFFLPFVRVVSANDRTGKSVTAMQIFNKKSATPNVPRDIRTMVGAMNDVYPENPEAVRELFALAMDGLEHLLGELVMGHDEQVGTALDPASIDLRGMNFLTVDNAVRGLELCLRSRFERLPDHANVDEAIADVVGRFTRNVERGWALHEEAWKQAKADGKQTMRLRIKPNGWKDQITVVIGHSDSRYFPAVARRTKADLIVQFYSDGRFVIARRGDKLSLDVVASHLRKADCVKRKGIMADTAKLAERNTTSYVEVDGAQIPQFFHAGFAFGNCFTSNPTGLAISALTEAEVVGMVKAALEGRTVASAWMALASKRK